MALINRLTCLALLATIGTGFAAASPFTITDEAGKTYLVDVSENNSEGQNEMVITPSDPTTEPVVIDYDDDKRITTMKQGTDEYMATYDGDQAESVTKISDETGGTRRRLTQHVGFPEGRRLFLSCEDTCVDVITLTFFLLRIPCKLNRSFYDANRDLCDAPEPTLAQKRAKCRELCGSDNVVGDPHMTGLLGQTVDWAGVDGGWYSLIKDDNADLNINVRLTAPLPDEFPERQLMTSLAVLSEGHSVVIEVANPYTIDTSGCPEGVSPCLANGGLGIIVDGQEVDELLRFSRQVPVADGAMALSASNLPVECRQFGGDKIWARQYQEIIEGSRQLLGDESLEEWILSHDQSMAAPGWCAKYIDENELADLQSNHAIFKIQTPSVTVRLNAGVNYQGDGELNWDGRVLPDLEFWQMDVGIAGLNVDNPSLSGLLGETARPVYDENGEAIMDGFEAFRGTVEDYRVSDALGVHFALLEKEEGHE